MTFNTPARPVTPADPKIVLDQNFAANAMAEMRKLGATNAAPPLAPSTHLKNIHTGVIFPWTPALAEQRDVLVNCDASGNTDPAVWRRTVRSEEEIKSQTELMQEAYASMLQPQGFMQQVPKQMNEPVNIPAGVQSLDKYLDSVADVTPESAQSLVALGNLME